MTPQPSPQDETAKEPCRQCGEFSDEFREGVCIYCADQNQMELDRHNAEFARWELMTDKQRDLAIRNAP